jgi:hypothetical protein
MRSKGVAGKTSRGRRRAGRAAAEEAGRDGCVWCSFMRTSGHVACKSCPIRHGLFSRLDRVNNAWRIYDDNLSVVGTKCMSQHSTRQSKLSSN